MSASKSAMAEYQVVFTARFSAQLSGIEEDFSGFGFAQTQRYIAQLVDQCLRLENLPYRFAKISFENEDFHSTFCGAHRIFYQISEENKQVRVVAVLHTKQNHSED
jgi:plasmid stabilization system protein ParE